MRYRLAALGVIGGLVCWGLLASGAFGSAGGANAQTQYGGNCQYGNSQYGNGQYDHCPPAPPPPRCHSDEYHPCGTPPPCQYGTCGAPIPPSPPRSISGLVESDGSAGSGSGFTTQHLGTGSYAITFPAGTWNGTTWPLPVVATATGNEDVHCVIYADTANSDGSAQIIVHTYDSAGKAQDSGFSFQATQGANPS